MCIGQTPLSPILYKDHHLSKHLKGKNQYEKFNAVLGKN